MTNLDRLAHSIAPIFLLAAIAMGVGAHDPHSNSRERRREEGQREMELNNYRLRGGVRASNGNGTPPQPDQEIRETVADIRRYRDGQIRDIILKVPEIA